MGLGIKWVIAESLTCCSARKPRKEYTQRLKNRMSMRTQVRRGFRFFVSLKPETLNPT